MMHCGDKSLRIYVLECNTLHMWFLFDPHIHVCGMFRLVTNNNPTPHPHPRAFVGTLNWTSIKESFCGVWSCTLSLIQSPWHSGDPQNSNQHCEQFSFTKIQSCMEQDTHGSHYQHQSFKLNSQSAIQQILSEQFNRNGPKLLGISLSVKSSISRDANPTSIFTYQYADNVIQVHLFHFVNEVICKEKRKHYKCRYIVRFDFFFYQT